MNTFTDKIQENNLRPAATNLSKSQNSNTFLSQLANNRPESIAQRKLHHTINNSPIQKQLRSYQAMADSYISTPIQRKQNSTGLPDNLKSGIENLSGYSMDDVKVHYNSAAPAQLQAFAYAKGTDIHVASGQEKHLPHEAWHVVQQKQGRVKPTIQMKGILNINNDVELEQEADVMGAKSMNTDCRQENSFESFVQKKSVLQDQVVQRRVGFEFETSQWILAGNSFLSPPLSLIKNKTLVNGNNWTLVADGNSPEFVTQPFDEINNNPVLAASMADLNIYTTGVTGNIAAGSVPLSNYPGVTTLGRLFNIVPGDANMGANPQFTAGISLASLRTMMTRLGTAGTTAQANLNNMPARSNILAQAAGGAAFPGVFSEEYRGIVALMGAYAATSAMLPFATFYKDIATLLSRTNFGIAFRTTPEYFAANTPLALANLKVQLAGHIVASAAAVALPAGAAVINTGMFMLPPIIIGMPDDVDNLPARTGPTILTWANSLVDGEDALEGSILNLLKWMIQNKTAGTDAFTSVSMGSMNNNEAVGPGGGTQGQIIEYRNLPVNVQHGQWQVLANNLLNWITRLNDPAQVVAGNTDY